MFWPTRFGISLANYPGNGLLPVTVSERILAELDPRPLNHSGLGRLQQHSRTTVRCLSESPRRRFLGALQLPDGLGHRGAPMGRIDSVSRVSRDSMRE
jgi:hypothetical protein